MLVRSLPLFTMFYFASSQPTSWNRSPKIVQTRLQLSQGSKIHIRNAEQPFSPFEGRFLAFGLICMICLPIAIAIVGAFIEFWRERNRSPLQTVDSAYWGKYADRQREKTEKKESVRKISKWKAILKRCFYAQPVPIAGHDDPYLAIENPVGNMANVNNVPLGRQRIDPRGGPFVPHGPGGTSAMNTSVGTFVGLPSVTVPPADPSIVRPDTATSQLRREAILASGHASRRASAMTLARRSRRTPSSTDGHVSPIVRPRHRHHTSNNGMLQPPQVHGSRPQSHSSARKKTADRAAKTRAFIHQARDHCFGDATCLIGSVRQLEANGKIKRWTSRSRKAKSSHL